MSDDGPPSAPRHPRIEQRSLLLRGGSGSGLDLGRLQRDVVGAIELPLRQAAAQQALLTQARRSGLGIVLSGETWRNQLDPAARGAAFDALPYAQPVPLELERGRGSPAALADYAESCLDAQLAAGATLATTPAHLFERELGEGREHDLALARVTTAIWRERQAWRPPPQRPDDAPRELYAGIAVRAAALVGDGASDSRVGGASASAAGVSASGSRASDARAAGTHASDPVPALIERYAALSVDGYWLTLFDGDDSAEQLGAVTALALGLQEASGRPVVLAGAGTAQTALLASGLAAVCTDVHNTRPQFPPARDDDGAVTAFALPVFHPAILGELPPGAPFAEARTRLFATNPCRCGDHVAYEPPHGRRATVAHNAWCLAAEARDATGLLPVFDEARLGARRQRADRMRARLDLEPLPAGWAAVVAAAATVRSGAIRAETDAGGNLHAL